MAGGGRSLLLWGETLLHAAAEYGPVAAAALLLDCRSDGNAQATGDEAGTGGQTHATDRPPRCKSHGSRKAPWDYERPGEIFECTALVRIRSAVCRRKSEENGE